MSAPAVRCDASELVAHLFDRSVHPELLSVRAARSEACGSYEARLMLCDSGHAVAVCEGGRTVTEVLAPKSLDLPEHGRLFNRAVRGGRSAAKTFPGGLRYEAHYQIETLPADVFAQQTEELKVDAAGAGLVCRVNSGHRLGGESLSLLRFEARPDGLQVHAFHTFAEALAVVRTQSLFTLG